MNVGMRRGGWVAMVVAAAAMIAMPSSACNEVVSWYADLKGGNESPAVRTQASGRATFVFDFEHPQATIQVDTQGLQGVEKIEFHACRTYTDVNGPVMSVLYQAKDGPLPTTFSKVITDADIVKVDQPKVGSIKDVANVVVNNQASVVVYTKAHPEGEIAGKITMHKTYVFSDAPGSKFHDPSLHRAHEGQAQGGAPSKG
jgi:hypothetical protein